MGFWNRLFGKRGNEDQTAPASAPGVGDRHIRVFVSSTFRDMQAERDILIKKIFPQLRKLCEERAVTWTEVDLRWGITTEEASEGKVLPLCLAEIQRCRPWFIGLLGERYGWVPKEKEVPPDLLEAQPWLMEHREHSVTELEIFHGVLRDPAMADRALFYFRDPAFLNTLPKDASPADFTSESTEAAVKLDVLKNKIRAEHADGKLNCGPRENYPDPETLGEMVLADFTAIIDQLYPKEEVPDPLNQEAMRHEAYARTRRLAFVGREELLQKMDEHVTALGVKPLVLTGGSGCGKSALLAEWVACWREKHRDDLIIQHYTGSTPESADWQGLVRRILGELKRAFAIADELPVQPDALRGALNDWAVKAAGSRRIVLALDALNQLVADGAARQLGWLPIVFPTNFRVLVSSLPGESLDVLCKRDWPELNVPLFRPSDIAPAASVYFHIFSKKLPQEILAKLESTPVATNALYLRAVLDELRQFGQHERLSERAAWYLAAPDLPELFDRILTRWHDDFGKDPEHPNLVHRSLGLIACARFGLSESELLDLLGKKSEPLPRRYWTPLYLAAENALVQRSGLLIFGHDYLRAAVQQRWLKNNAAAKRFRLSLAEYFGNIPEPTDRKLDELPTLLRDTVQWERLRDLLADLQIFRHMRQHMRRKWELHGYWLALDDRFDPVEIYNQALAAGASDLSPQRLAPLLNDVARFHQDAGRYAGAEQLFRRALEGDERVLGLEHPNTLTSVNNLAMLLKDRGDYAGAEQLFRRALEGDERVLGLEHPNTLSTMNNFAGLLMSTGDFESAERFLAFVLEARQRILGTDHPDTLTSMNNLAGLLEKKQQYDRALLLYRTALDSRERVLGRDHPDTLVCLTNLAGLLTSTNDYATAERHFRRALEARERVLGADHPDTLASISNLGVLLQRSGDYVEAERLFRRALEGDERVLGLEHPDTLRGVNNLAMLLLERGDYAGAEPLLLRVLVGLCALSGAVRRPHPHLQSTVSRYAHCLRSTGVNKEEVKRRINQIISPYGLNYSRR